MEVTAVGSACVGHLRRCAQERKDPSAAVRNKVTKSKRSTPTFYLGRQASPSPAFSHRQHDCIGTGIGIGIGIVRRIHGTLLFFSSGCTSLLLGGRLALETRCISTSASASASTWPSPAVDTLDKPSGLCKAGVLLALPLLKPYFSTLFDALLNSFTHKLLFSLSLWHEGEATAAYNNRPKPTIQQWRY